MKINEYKTRIEQSNRELERDIEKWKKNKLVLPLPIQSNGKEMKVVRIVELTEKEKKRHEYMEDIFKNIALSGSDSESDIESDVESDIATDDAIRDISCDLRSSEISIGSSFVVDVIYFILHMR